MSLRVLRLHPYAKLPVRAHAGDAGYDLHALEPVALEPGERAMVRTGLAIELAPGHAGWVVPRSGLAYSHGLALVNAPGLIDASYRGEVRVLLLNTDRATRATLEAGDRIAQLVVMAVAAPDVLEVTELSASARGAGGFGSTGAV